MAELLLGFVVLCAAPQDEAAAAIAAAQAALDEGRAADAIDLLGGLPYGEEPPLRALVIAGRAHLALGRPEGAVSLLLRASDRAPDDAELAREAAIACYRSAQGSFARAYLEDARRYAERAGDELLRGDIEFALGEFEAALAHYRAVDADTVDRLTLLRRLADTRSRLDDEGAARDAWRAVLEEAIARGELRVAYRAAEFGSANGRLLSWLDERLAEEPDAVELRLYRGYARARALLYEEAADDLRAVLATGREDPAITARLAHCLVRQGMRMQDAELRRRGADLALETIRRWGPRGDAWAELQVVAWYEWVNRDVEGAYAVLKEMHALAPDDFDVGLNYAAMARRLGFYDETEGVYDRLLEEAPGDPVVLVDYGILADARGDRARAVELWERALAEDPRNLDALENLYTAAWEAGDTPQARERITRALEIARQRGNPALVERWLWFRDRLRWAPTAFGG